MPCRIGRFTQGLPTMPAHRPAGAFALLLIAFCQASVLAQPPSVADNGLRDAFQSPPAEFRPLVITHSMPLNRDDATELLSARRAGGAVIDVGITPGSTNLTDEPWNNAHLPERSRAVPEAPRSHGSAETGRATHLDLRRTGLSQRQRRRTRSGRSS